MDKNTLLLAVVKIKIVCPWQDQNRKTSDYSRVKTEILVVTRSLEFPFSCGIKAKETQ